MSEYSYIMTTKEKLIQSALKLFNKNWFEATSTTSICKDAGFSSWALFVHFKTKNDLLDYLYVDIKKKYYQYVFTDISETYSPEDQLRNILKVSFDFYLKNYDEYMFLKRFSSSVHISRIAQEEVDVEWTQFYSLYNKWVEQGTFIKGNFAVLFQMQAAMFYSWVEYVKNNGKQDIDSIIDLILKVIKK